MDIALDTIITSPAAQRLGLKAETLEQSYRRNHRNIGALYSGEWMDAARLAELVERHSINASAGSRVVEANTRDRWGQPDETLTIGQVYALWVYARLEEIDQRWSDETDANLARCRSGEMSYGADYSAAQEPVDRRRARARTATLKSAYGLTWTQWMSA